MQGSTLIAIVSIIVGASVSVISLAMNFRMESKRALLARGSHLYDRRVDVIATLYELLRDTELWFQQIASSAVFKGEPPRNETAGKAIESYQRFVREVRRSRVLLPVALAERTEALISAFSEAGLKYSYATDPTFPDGQSRADDWTALNRIVREKVPELLAEFEGGCRAILEPQKAPA